MELTYKEVEERILETLEKRAPEQAKQFIESPELQELLKQHVNKEILPSDTINGEPVPFAQSAKLMRAIMRGNDAEARTIQKEEIDKYIDFLGIEGKTANVYLTETSNEQGLYLCPIEWYTKFFEIAQAFGIARRDCLVIPMTTKIMYIHRLTVRPTTFWVAPQVDLDYRAKGVTKPKVGRLELKPAAQVAIVAWEEELLADATPPLMQLIVRLMATSFTRGEDDALFNGAAAATITGILNDLTVQVVTMGAGDIGFANVDADDLLDMIDTVDALCSGSLGKFYFHPNTLTHLRRLKDANLQYIWNAPAANAPGTIWGRPYETTCVMPSNADTAPSTKFIVYGNLKEAVAFGDRQRMTIKLLTEASIDLGSGTATSLAQNNMAALRFTERLDIEVVLGEVIAVLRTHA